MLQLIGYDLQEPTKFYPALHAGVERAGGGVHILNGPVVYGADKSPNAVLKAVAASLKKAGSENDKLLVFPVLAGEIGTGRRPKRKPIKRHAGTAIFAVAYTLRNPKGEGHLSKAAYEKHRMAVIRALMSLGPTCHPLGSLWLVKTGMSAHDVHRAIEKAVPLTPNDELVVAEVYANGLGAQMRLDAEDRDWLKAEKVL
jgi:hypothetical protein